MYNFALLDPRPIPVAQAANEAIFATGPAFGIEVTVPALASRCVTNLDPQHSGGDATRAAIEDALMCELPPEEATLVTVRADLDAIGAMAIFSLRGKGEWEPYFGGGAPALSNCSSCGWDHDPGTMCLDAVVNRVAQVSAADKFARGGYSGSKPLPTRDNPWSEGNASAESSRSLAAIAAAVMDFKVPLTDRVGTMEKWLLTGEEPQQYRDSVERERLDMITALESGAIKHETRSGGRIAVVESTHRAATMVGYSLAPVVVALNPNFKLGGGEPHRKFTVCAFEAQKFVNIKAALTELATLEAGWGGSPTIGGSPQGVSSTLTIDSVVGVVQKHLL